MVRWFAARPTFRDGDRPMAGAPIVLGPLAGDRFQHRFEWIPQDDTCDAVRARTRLAWVLVFERLPSERPVSRTGRCLSRSRATFRGLGFSVYGG
jgi:hypothetical protein